MAAVGFAYAQLHANAVVPPAPAQPAFGVAAALPALPGQPVVQPVAIVPPGVPVNAVAAAPAAVAVRNTPVAAVSAPAATRTASASAEGYAGEVRMNLAQPVFEATGKEDTAILAKRARAFVRDMTTWLNIWQLGHLDPARVIAIQNSLQGVAKDWYSEWFLAREEYTSAELLAAFKARFAPHVYEPEYESRVALSNPTGYGQRSSESVAAYQSRLEALFTSIPTVTESERLFWFLQGLQPELKASCALDREYQPFQEYAMLVRAAIGEERRLLTAQPHKRTAAVSVATDEPVAKHPHHAAPAPVAPAENDEDPGPADDDPECADPELSHITHPVTGQRASKATVRAWRKAGLCYKCLTPGHVAEECTN